MAKFNRGQVVLVILCIIAIFYIAAPTAEVTHLLHQFFHAVLAFLMTLLG